MALAWLARLPLLTDEQLAVLIGLNGWGARAVLNDLRRRDMIERIVVDSPEFDATLRLSYLTTGAWRRLPGSRA